MICLKEDFVSGAIFHIYNHVIDNYQLFYDDIDYNFMINILEKNIKVIPSSIYAYCLMPDHYHFLIKQNSETEVFKLFNYSFIRYAIYYNKKYNRKGPIFQSPLQHKIIESNTYLLHLCKYIHLNPIRKDLVDNPEDWAYSNYNDWIGKSNDILTPKDICEKLFITQDNYKNFINSISNYLSNKDILNFISF